MKKHAKRRLLFNFIVSYVTFFLLAGLITTLSVLMYSHFYETDFEHIRDFAPYALANILFASFLFAIIGTLWRFLTVEIPISKINEGLQKICKGDLKTKLQRRRYSSRYSTLIKNINLMTEELSSIDKMKESLLSNISHEFKTPISVINNYSTLLQDTSLTPEQVKEYSKEIAASSRQMSELVTNILKLNRLENQQIPTDAKPYNLSEQLCECLLNFESIWEDKQIEIFTEIEDDVIVNSNRQLLDIVWNNLFSNAFKFTPNGGTVSISLSNGNRYAIVKISDSGCGIPENESELIFDKFYQCDSSRATEGNGLGLALVKRIVNITNSIIKVESTKDSGTTFTVKIKK